MAQSGAGGGSTSTGPSRLGEFLGSVPVITRALLVVNVTVHVVIFVFSLSLNTFAISANLVVGSSEYYRVVSAAFVHAGLMHIFMNMSSLLQLGLSLEAHFGSLQFLFLSVWSVLIVGTLYVGLAVLFSYVDEGQYYASGVGYSGVLFTYALIEAYHTTETSRSIFGFFTVPAKMYPFILLIILQVVIPNISFLGHFSGILVGLMVVHGGLAMLLPCTEFLIHLESTPLFGPLTKATGYVRANNRSLLHGQESMTCLGCSTSAGVLFSNCALQVWNVLAALLYIVGCPVERITRCFADACSAVRSCCLGAVPTNPISSDSARGGGVELGRYARIENDVDERAASSPVDRGSEKGPTVTVLL